MYLQVSSFMQSLRIADPLIIGEILLAKKLYSNLQSARVNAQKKLNALVALGQLQKGTGYYRTLDCQSEYKEHSRLITKALAEVLKLEVQSTIFREIAIPEVGLRPDAICLLTKDDRGYCLILEVCNNETPEYLQSKINTWSNWQEDTLYLSKLFGYKIPHYEIVPITVMDGFKSFLREAL